MTHKNFGILGIIAPIAYAIFVIVGGAITPGYSHTAQAISELTATGSPHKLFLDFLFSAYNIMLIGFGAVFLQYVRGKQQLRLSGKLGSWCIMLIGAMGLLTNLFFPMDPRGASATTIGIIHLILAGLLSLGTILATLLVGLWLIKQPDHKRAGIFSLIACAVIVLTGGLAAAAAATVSPIMGLLQRLTIGTFMLWVLFFGIKISNSSEKSRAI